MARRRALATLVLLLAACASDGAAPRVTSSSVQDSTVSSATTSSGPTSTAETASSSFELERIEPSPREPVVAALEISDVADIPTTIRFSDPSFGPPAVASGDLRPGGPGPDGIPSIDRPRFERVADATFLSPREPVVVLDSGPRARAYPLQIMVWHEIVNDVVDGVPVAVTYCPLCNSAFAFERRHDGRVLSFGVSGALWNSSLVMFDRQTLSLWGHFNGLGILGHLAGVQLRPVPVSIVSWATFAAARPDGYVLSRDTGYGRSYGKNPYPGYDDASTSPFLFEGTVDGRLVAKARVVGISVDGGAVAVVSDRLARDGAVSVTVGGRELVVLWTAGTTSALDGARVDDGRDVGATGVFERTLDGRALTFAAAGDAFRDAETDSTWNVLGEATGGVLAGRRLTPVRHVDTFWFAWAAFEPETTIVS